MLIYSEDLDVAQRYGVRGCARSGIKGYLTVLAVGEVAGPPSQTGHEVFGAPEQALGGLFADAGSLVLAVALDQVGVGLDRLLAPAQIARDDTEMESCCRGDFPSRGLRTRLACSHPQGAFGDIETLEPGLAQN